MEVKALPLGPIGTNCYIIHNEGNALIIDPGGNPEKVMALMEDLILTPKAILLTHAHFDHIGAVQELREKYQIDVYLHSEEKNWLQDASLNGSLGLMGQEITTYEAENELQEGDTEMYGFTFEIRHTPGHSPGSVSFVFHDQSIVISGDVLFKQGIGRTDLTGGDINVLENSIRNKLYNLSDGYTVFPGHGPETTIGFEKQQNPFFPDH
ncbi:metallo-beta-lactamase family protein [Oceanobacillus picturae]|uniref:Metallo-beta-lactamase family protein n=1 Tax=Oceanobacillus picturae TaxID=171693 RepID=W9A7X9_9BACI|nr:MBL fold metallo-hydrolase [Oceanobacillus picturae]RIU93523.1 MBL fold metallo-hydrolase [Oceanobacillus picturae]GAQ19812.1 metallo-beta-lactamase family protein [Oceanobacillus picturae]CDO01899.1 putative polyketide biosynthesis zinc-dependent hydrolase PksB [Oceanobacillus picturae]